jgi:hypothetical protein
MIGKCNGVSGRRACSIRLATTGKKEHPDGHESNLDNPSQGHRIGDEANEA